MRLDDKTLAEKLESMPAAEPPPELLERLKNDIPETPGLRAVPPGDEPPAPGRASVPWLRLAASAVLLVGGGMFAYWVVERAPELSAGLVEGSDGEPAPAMSEPGKLAPEEMAQAPESLAEGSEDVLATEGRKARTEIGSGGRQRDGAVSLELDDQSTVATESPRLDELERPLQPGVEAPAEAGADQSFAVDGVTVGEMEAIGSSPTYEDFDELQELDQEKGKSGATQPAHSAPHAVPVPDPTPDEPVQYNQKIERMEKEAKQLEEKVRALGYVGEREAEPAPRRKVVPMPPPPPPVMRPSTGGTTEPNDQPYGDVFFQGYGTNPFVDTEDDALSTFGFDVDTGSYGVVRRYLRDGNLPPADAVRVEEIVNAFDYGDPAPRRGTFGLSAEGAPSPWPPGERYYLLRLAVKGREIQRTEERPVDLVFVIDTSGSMNYENRLGLVKRALALLLERLGPDDRVALVTYGSRGEVRLPFTRDAETLRWTVERLHPDGATNAEEGLTLAYDLMARQGRRGAVRRVLLCSDGVANVGATGPESILERIGEGARSGVELTTVGFGMGNYNDVLMEQLADRGNGRYAYVDTLDEARRLFVEELTGTLYSIAAEARAQVEFDPRVVSRYRLIGYENRDIADERFRDDTVDAAEIGSGHTVTALYEVKLREGVRPERGEGRRLGTLRVRFRPIDSERFEEGSLPLDLGILAPSWSSASRAFHLSAVAARFAEILRGSYWARGGDLHELARRAERIAAEWRGEERIAELADLIRRAADLAPEGGGS